MGVVQILSKHEYQGLSTDTKPVGPDGSTYHAVDTGEVYVLHEGCWTRDYRNDPIRVTNRLE